MSITITNGYTSLAVYKQRFYDEGQGDTKDDAAIGAVIEATSRAIDLVCWQRFFTTAADETRYYTAELADTLKPPDRIVSVTTLKTDADGDRTYEDSWTEDTDFDLMPYNATLDGIPYHSIVITPNGSYRFPTTPKGVEIAGKFGWAAAPKGVVEACLLYSHRLMARRNTPLGVSGAAAVGELTMTVTQMKADPEIMELLDPYVLRY